MQKNIYFFSFWLLVSARKKIDFARKNNGFARARGGAAPRPLTRSPMTSVVVSILADRTAIIQLAQ